MGTKPDEKRSEKEKIRTSRSCTKQEGSPLPGAGLPGRSTGVLAAGRLVQRERGGQGLVTVDRGGGEAPRTACLRRTRSICRGGHSAHTSIIKRLETIQEAPRTA